MSTSGAGGPGDIYSGEGRVEVSYMALEVGVPVELYEYYGLTVAGVVGKALELAKR